MKKTQNEKSSQNTKKKTNLILVILACFAVVFAVGCGNSPPSTHSHERGLTVSSPQTASQSLEQENTQTNQIVNNQNQISSTVGQVRAAQDRSSGAAENRTRRVQTNEQESETSLRVRRLVVSRGIEDREPVGASSRFRSNNERLYAFVEMSNRDGSDDEVVVTFQNEDGDEFGHIELEIPSDVPRWRTWAYSRMVTDPGTWTAIIRTTDGTELARERFEIEG